MINILDIKEAIPYLRNQVNNVIPRMNTLEKYYLGQNKILSRKDRINDYETHRIPNNYAKYITTQTTNYFMGSPVDYIIPNDDKNYINLDYLLRYNEENSHNNDLANDCSIFGVGYELCYYDEQSEFNFNRIDPRYVIVVKDGSIKSKITDAIIIDIYDVDVDNSMINLKIYDDANVVEYEAKVDKVRTTDFSVAKFKYVKEYPHNMAKCPIIEYKNNQNSTGDFENVIELIDAYDKISSLSLDDCTDFTNAYLILTGFGDLDEQLTKDIRESGMMSLDDGGTASWLIKSINDTFIENVKNRLNKDIHKFSSTVDMSDENLYNGAISGIAIRFKFQSLEQLRAEKEKWFRKGIRARLDLISNHLSKLSTTINVLDIDIRFSKNLPVNLLEEVQAVNQLTGIVSKRSQLGLLSFISDIEAELDLINKEGGGYNDSDFNNVNNESSDEDAETDI